MELILNDIELRSYQIYFFFNILKMMQEETILNMKTWWNPPKPYSDHPGSQVSQSLCPGSLDPPEAPPTLKSDKATWPFPKTDM